MRHLHTSVEEDVGDILAELAFARIGLSVNVLRACAAADDPLIKRLTKPNSSGVCDSTQSS